RIMKAHEAFEDYATLMQHFAELEVALQNYDYEAVLQVLAKVVSGFNHTSGVVDYLKVTNQTERQVT
ncbi:MAG: hypothetical protein IE937_05985, partial [Gammaproteobacteria bacterium]|nr:hypothetical protein [Gammaproteobacteria bacterium]